MSTASDGSADKSKDPFVVAMERLVDSLIAALNDIAGDPDLEDSDEDENTGDDEPSLGSTTAINQDSRYYHGGPDGMHGPDLEEEHDGREPEEDADTGNDEPSLAGIEVGAEGSQEGIFCCGDGDLEADLTTPDRMINQVDATRVREIYMTGQEAGVQDIGKVEAARRRWRRGRERDSDPLPDGSDGRLVTVTHGLGTIVNVRPLR